MTNQQIRNLINIFAARRNIAWAKDASNSVFRRYREQINMLNECMYLEQRYLNAFIKDQEAEIYAENILMLCWTGR